MGVSKLINPFTGEIFKAFLHNECRNIAGYTAKHGIFLINNYPSCLHGFENSFSIKGCNVLKSNKSAEISELFDKVSRPNAPLLKCNYSNLSFLY
jgi:hypothetical protein